MERWHARCLALAAAEPTLNLLVSTQSRLAMWLSEIWSEIAKSQLSWFQDLQRPITSKCPSNILWNATRLPTYVHTTCLRLWHCVQYSKPPVALTLLESSESTTYLDTGCLENVVKKNWNFPGANNDNKTSGLNCHTGPPKTTSLPRESQASCLGITQST